MKLSDSQFKDLILEEVRSVIHGPNIQTLNIEELVIEKGDGTYGLTLAYKHHRDGIKSKTEGPLDVCWLKNENKYLVVDGYHRLIEYLLEGEHEFECNIDWTGHTTEWSVPTANDRFIVVLEKTE